MQKNLRKEAQYSELVANDTINYLLKAGADKMYDEYLKTKILPYSARSTITQMARQGKNIYRKYD